MRDLDIARQLAQNGVPIFLAKPAPDFPRGGSDDLGYLLPRGWQKTVPDPAVLDDWVPGMAVCAVMGHVVDAVDIDPRNLSTNHPLPSLPRSFGRQTTPSGGTHDLIGTLGVHSRDGLAPGLDVKAGVAGKGHGFIFLAPTRKRSKETGEVEPYRWEIEPDLTGIEFDESGADLADLISNRKPAPVLSGYTGAGYDQLPGHFQSQADAHTENKIRDWARRLSDAVEWPEGYRDPAGRGWELLARDAAWALATLAVCPWTNLSEAEATRQYGRILPPAFASDPKCNGKWYPGLLEKAAAEPVELPPWSDFDPVLPKVGGRLQLPKQLEDLMLSVWIMEEALENEWRYYEGLGWYFWNGRNWDPVSNRGFEAVVSGVLRHVNSQAASAGLDKANLKAFRALLSNSKIRALTESCTRDGLADASDLDSHPHLLNVQNGVVDLRTGELKPHDRALNLSKITEVEYHPDATHADWDKSLSALDPEVAAWMQTRLGQAATGEASGSMPILQGGGANGKTTMITAVANALGTYAQHVPSALLVGAKESRNNEKMTLYGLRLAYIEETPEDARLDLPQAKQLIDTPLVTARRLYQDYIEFKASHSLFLLTNYDPRVRETDYGSWRRLVMVRFEQTFEPDRAFKDRLLSGREQLEAALAWVVEGARRWYANPSDDTLPAKVDRDTAKWRRSSDDLQQFLDDRLVFSMDHCVSSKDFGEVFNEWLRSRGQHEWSIQTLQDRMQHHPAIAENEVVKALSLNPKGFTVPYGAPPERVGRLRVWKGLRWRTSEDDVAESHLQMVK